MNISHLSFFISIYLGTVGIVLLSIGVGFRLGIKTRRNKKSRNLDIPSIGTLVGAMLALLAFILAFVFSMTSARYDARKQLVLEQANMFGTAMLRTEFLADSPRDESRKLLQEYISLGVEAVQNPDKIARALVEIQDIHARLWDIANDSSNQEKDSELVGRYIDSLNELIDLHSTRVVVGLQYRIPKGVWLLVYFITILTMMSVGYEFGLTSSNTTVGFLLLALMFSAVILVIVDLDNPAKSIFVTVSQQPLIEVQEKFGSLDNPALSR
ncbi:MAG: hypothetical protein AB4050_00465 [Synechococcus sp.]